MSLLSVLVHNAVDVDSSDDNANDVVGAGSDAGSDDV